MNSMSKTVVITGGTRGIGFGMAQEFLRRGCKVMISGRSTASVDKALAQLRPQYGDNVAGYPCDISSYEQLQALWDAAKAAFGQVDIWINNAASTLPMKNITEQDPAALRALVDANLTGVMFASQIALNGMHKQGSGHLYNMEGSGSDGRVTVGLTPYGSTKVALTFLTRSLMKEMKDSPVKVSLLSPGMVITDLWTDLYAEDPQRLTRIKRILNILGDKVEIVAPWLVTQILNNDRSGIKIAWLTRPKIFARFLSAPFNKRDLFAD
jgi:NAD(P)-dependent dehydrogenase (short-subunit alcohol dehydrogenase family)